MGLKVKTPNYNIDIVVTQFNKLSNDLAGLPRATLKTSLNILLIYVYWIGICSPQLLNKPNAESRIILLNKIKGCPMKHSPEVK